MKNMQFRRKRELIEYYVTAKTPTHKHVAALKIAVAAPWYFDKELKE